MRFPDFKYLSVVLAFLGFAVVSASLAIAQTKTGGRSQPENPIVFTADEVTHDKELGIIRASGSVEISHDNQVLLADTISYNERQDIVSATGNVSLLEESGHVLFAEFMELSGDFKEGII